MKLSHGKGKVEIDNLGLRLVSVYYMTLGPW